MALTLYLAMTGAEIQNCPHPPAHVAWMACHFSPYSTGISNVPPLLVPGSMLILNDRIPPQGHDPELVAQQLVDVVSALDVDRVLLDFQRPGDPLTQKIADVIVQALPCPVGVAAGYAESLRCPVFLTPALHKPLAEQLAAWQGHEIWLEAALDCQDALLTEQGCTFIPADVPQNPPTCHSDPQLHCHYSIVTEEQWARFTLWRDAVHLQTLLREAADRGINCAVGLYQQLKHFKK